MKLVTFTHHGLTSPGVLMDNEIIDLATENNRLPSTMAEILQGGDDAMSEINRTVTQASSRIPLDEVRLEAPVPNPRKFLGLGFSYASHVAEIKKAGIPIDIPDNQVWFNKQVSCIHGPYAPIHLPTVSDQLDYEGELAVVIGRYCRHVKAEDGLDMVAGYMVCNDVSIRDWQMRAPTAHLGKSFDTHGPTGPW